MRQYGILAAITGIAFFVYLLLTSYVDFLGWCRIAVEGDMISGNKGAVISAIKKLKKEKRESYNTMCEYVDRIIENDCLAVEPRINSSWSGLYADGCYIRGSKTIYIKPEKNGGEESVARRESALLRYAEFSKKFWDEQKK